MAGVVTARRSLLPLAVLRVLAERCEVPLPPGWGADPAEAPGGHGAAARLLVEAGLVSESGEPREGLREALSPLRTPLLTLDVSLAPVAERAPMPADQPAAAFTGAVVVGERALVGLLRRDGVPLAELSLAAPEALGPSVERLLAAVPTAPPAASVQERITLAAFVALSVFEGRFDPDRFAAVHGCDADAAARVAALLGETTATLQVLVVGDRSVPAPPVGQVLFYRTAAGWLEAATEGDDVVLRSTEPIAALPAVTALVAGAL
ncbi:MAG TPA: hypothetical protein VGX28_08870 [Frankiaceae bacterium]|jgi:hypothetical protein|nr:hypothetical protein [Frankiaceae bacterium]